MKDRLILITGPKHSGKSMTALALGKITGRQTADLDEIIERQTGKTPRALFKEGPDVFKEAEARALNSLMQNQERRIVAAGGGLIDNPKALALLQHQKIIVVYLDVSPETAWQRIQNTAAGGELPPFLITKNPRVEPWLSPEETHFALHKRRAEAYKVLARFTVAAENKSPEEIAREIANRLEL